MQRAFKLTVIVSIIILALAASLPALAAPELPDGKISVGHIHDIFMVSPSGELVAWGSDDLGLMQWRGACSNAGSYDERVTLFDKGISSVAASYFDLFILTDDSTLYGCGHSTNNAFAGQAPRDYASRAVELYNHSSLYPIRIMDDVTMISAGLDLFVALKTDGSVWAWGQLEDRREIFFPPVKIADGCRYISGYFYITESGGLYQWHAEFPSVWDDSKDSGTVQEFICHEYICSGAFALNSLLHMENGEVYNAEAYIEAHRSGSPLPEPVAHNVRKLCPGGYITEDGTLYSYSDYDGTSVKLLDNVESAICGTYTCIAVTRDGYVYGTTIESSTYETLRLLGTVEDLAPEYDPPLNPWPLILGVANKIFELIPLLAVI